jgi:hypothetical protein
VKPPKKVLPEVLFRRLSAYPRSTQVLGYRIAGAEDVVLSVKAMASHEVYGFIDGAKDIPTSVVCASLLADGEQAFSSPSEVFRMHKEEVDTLYGEVAEALASISPLYASIDHAAWMAVLKEGAIHSTNAATAWAMSECVDTAVGASGTIRTNRPDRYYGIPVREMTDGHRLAFSAAREAIDELREDSEK